MLTTFAGRGIRHAPAQGVRCCLYILAKTLILLVPVLFAVTGVNAEENIAVHTCEFETDVYAYLLSESSLELKPSYWFFSQSKLSDPYYSKPVVINAGQKYVILSNEAESWLEKWFYPGNRNQVVIEFAPVPAWAEKYNVPFKLDADENFMPKYSRCV
jgi:hypothetical protein